MYIGEWTMQLLVSEQLFINYFFITQYIYGLTDLPSSWYTNLYTPPMLSF